MGWLEDLVESTSESETPERFMWWSGLAAISAVVGKNVWLDKHVYTLYPNIYVALISAHSGLRKGAAISAARGILKYVNGEHRVISGSNSIQAVIKELSQQETLDNGNVVSKAQGILMSPEFKDFLTGDESSLSYLVDLYDTHDHPEKWTRTLKGSGREILKEPCLTLLIASNEIYFDSAIGKADTEGGFIARTFIIYESENRLYNSLIRPPSKSLDKKRAAKRLQELTALRGGFVYEGRAAEIYDQWYKDLCAAGVRGDRTGHLARIHDHVLKVAMLMTLSETDELVLTQGIIDAAIVKCTENLAGVRQISVSNASGNAEQDVALPRIIKVLIHSPNLTVNRKELLRRTELDSVVLSRAIETLIERDLIYPGVKAADGSGIQYQMKPEAYKAYSQLKEKV